MTVRCGRAAKPIVRSYGARNESRAAVVRGMTCETHGEYEVVLAPGLLTAGRRNPDLQSVLAGRQVLILTTPTVASLVGPAVVDVASDAASSVKLIVLRCSEQTKTLRSVERLCDRARTVGIEREALIVALGGGVCSDLVTFAAAVIRRGIDHIRLPTTLVAQVDAAVGIKGAVNHAKKKSFLGVFHPPQAVLVDVSVLGTLPQRSVSDGLAEIIKIALVRRADLFDLVATDATTLVSSRFQCDGGEQLIAASIDAIMQELQPNIYESRSYERRVDFGHTFSPALEGAHRFRITHGMAVAVDIALSAAIGVELGSLQVDQFERILDVISSSGLPTYSHELTSGLCEAALSEAERHRGGNLNLVVPDGIGEVLFVQDAGEVAATVIPDALRRLRSAQPRRSKTAVVG